jgi:type I restriction enzyme M protein
VRGIVAGFWYDAKYDFLTLMARGAKGVADAWRTSILTALDDKASKDSPLEHKLVKFLMSRLRRGHHRTGSAKAELDSQIKAASPKDAEAKTATSRRGCGDDEPARGRSPAQGLEEGARRVKKQLKAKKTASAQHNAAVDGARPEPPPSCC